MKTTKKGSKVHPVELGKYFKCWKCGCVTITDGKVPDYVCCNSMPVRTSGICGGSFTIKLTKKEIREYKLTCEGKSKK